MNLPYEQTSRRTHADPERRVSPPEQDPAEVQRNNILGYLEEALSSLGGLEIALMVLEDIDKSEYYKILEKVNQHKQVSRITALKWLREDLEEWQNEEEPD